MIGDIALLAVHLVAGLAAIGIVALTAVAIIRRPPAPDAARILARSLCRDAGTACRRCTGACVAADRYGAWARHALAAARQEI